MHAEDLPQKYTKSAQTDANTARWL